MASDLILGTAGHIDHGKTSLIKALTGVDTDRLPEEKRRGITIDLGFAHLQVGPYRLGIVDVPGHERFVRNMLAGATGMDLALLVVAADDSVKPQTREHLEILRLLDLPAGVIALTKCDLVEPEWWDAIGEEIHQAARGTVFEQATIVPTSVVTGYGLEQLKQELQRVAAIAAQRRAERLDAPFRMAIDRVFVVAGHGTVVTGSVSAGRTFVGDQLVLEPGGIEVRVRGIHNHDRPVEEIHRGQRAAINLAGVHHEQIRRGHELAAPGHLQPSQVMSVQLRVSPSAPRPLRNRSQVRLHLGTAELLARVRLLDSEQLAPGQSALAQVVLSEPAVAEWRQPFVIRSESPVTTIGGGSVLHPFAELLRRPTDHDMQRMADLVADNPLVRAAAALYFQGTRAWKPSDLVWLAGIVKPEPVLESLRQKGELIDVRVSAQRQLSLHPAVLDRIVASVEATLSRLHDEFPLRMAFELPHVFSRVRPVPESALFDAAIERAALTGRIRRTSQGIALPGRGPTLSQAESQLIRQLITTLRQAGINVPTVAQLQASAGRHAARVPELLELAVGQGELVRISDEFYLHRQVDEELRKLLSAKLAQSAGATLSEIREWLGTSRKYAVPYCEYLDRIGFTERVGDVRTLRQADAGVNPSSRQPA